MITLYFLAVSLVSLLGMYLLYLPYKMKVEWKWLENLDSVGLFIVVVVWFTLQAALLSVAVYSLVAALISPLIYLIPSF